jgi:hypothetical protein
LPKGRFIRVGFVALVAVVVATGAVDGTARPAQAARLQACDASAYALALRSLTTPPRADLTIGITSSTADCALPESLDDVQVTIFARRGAGRRRLDVPDVASPGGTAIVPLGRVLRHQRVEATIAFSPQIVLTDRTTTLLKPDLVLKSVTVPRTALGGRAFDVGVRIHERTPDVGTTATVTVSTGQTVLQAVPVRIAPQRNAVMHLPVTLQTPGRARIDVTITGADPAEATTRNNARHATTEVTEFEVVPTTVLVPSLAGYGGQFNEHVYAALSRSVGVTDENVGEMERKMRELHPQFSRIFFTPQAFADPDKMQSFVRTVLLAQSTGTTINITWQGGTLSVASGTVQKFANVLLDLVQNRGVTHLRWLTLQNEPNSTKMTPAQYEAQYRALDPYILNIRGQVHYMGGDLVRNGQTAWLQYFAAHMTDILDAYSIHVFWDYWDTQKIVDRLTEVRSIVDTLPEAARKPLYVAEYGVRGLRTLAGAPQVDPGVWTDGTLISRTNVGAFQHAWFDILSARLGYVGTSKWDSYFGKYDNGTQAYFMIGGPQEGWPEFPMYNFMHLITTTVRPGWKVVGVDSVPDTSRLLTAYLSPVGEKTIVGLDTAGAQLNTVSPDAAVSYTIGGLPPSRKLRLAIWNQSGDGLDGPTVTVTTDAAGVTAIAVPQQAVFVLTTLRLA